MSTSAGIASIASSNLDGTSVVEGIFHELSALGIFVLSFLLWNYAKSRRLQNGKPPSLLAVRKQTVVAQRGRGPERPSQKKTESPKVALQDNVLEIEQQMCGFLQQKEFTRALYLFKSLERSGRDAQLKNEELFSLFVQSAIRVEKLDVVEKMLRVQKRNGVELTARSWRTMLRMLSTKKRFSTCLLAYSIFEEDIPADQVVFSCLINAALDSGMATDAAKMLSKYRSSGLQPVEWILFFRTYVTLGDVEQAEATFREVGAEMTPLMLNLLLLTCVNANQLDRAERCLKEAHELEAGKEVKLVNAVSYNTIIKGFSQQGQFERCFDCLRGLFEHGLEPDETTVGMVVDVCLQDDCVGIADRLMKSVRQSGAATSTVMCTHFLKLLIRTDRLKDAAELYEDMKRLDSTRPNVVSCSMLIKAYVYANDLKHALYIFDDMNATGCKADDIILTRLLEGCRQVGDSQRGMNVFDRCVKMGVTPSEFSILILLKLLGTAGKHAAAHEIVTHCEQRFGTKPTIIHYTCLVSGALRSKSYEQAWQAYLLMCQHGVQPDATAISTLLPALVGGRQWERVLEIVSSALKDVKPPLSIPVEMLNHALSHMISESGTCDRQHVLRLKLLMQGAGIPITAQNAQLAS